MYKLDAIQTKGASAEMPLGWVPDNQELSGDISKVTINRDDTSDLQVQRLTEVISRHQKLFQPELGQAVEPESKWMSIPIREGEVLKSPRPYRMSP